jgi:hypothetical protein
MPSATDQGSYASITTIFDPPSFTPDTTFKCKEDSKIIFCCLTNIYRFSSLTAQIMLTLTKNLGGFNKNFKPEAFHILHLGLSI